VTRTGTTESDDWLRDLQEAAVASQERLSVEDLLTDLLDRVRVILSADTAAVLMVDEASGQLVARAAAGLEEEVRQGVHVPLGVGFAGRIGLTRRPVMLDRVDPTTVSNPILWEKGIRVMLGVPLLAGNRLLGVLHVGRLEDHPFESSDAELLRIVAERVVAALEIRHLAIERAAASLLERSLHPSTLPVCPGLEFATRYITSDDRSVGGDWYDVFTVPTGELWMVVGDVAGHGLNSAVVMGRIKSTLRAYALAGGTPEQVLTWTDRKIHHFEMDAVATAICAVSSPPYARFRVSRAGHPPPVLAGPESPAVLVDSPVDPPLGAPLSTRSGFDVEVPDGGVLVLYTDGLFERRGEALDASLERLRGSVRGDRPDTVCRDVLRQLVGKSTPEDDIAIVAVQRKPGTSAACERAEANATRH
jgi:phosphoserine phosphatase RsbU/P